MGVSSLAMLAALIAGERDPQVLAELAKGVMRKRIPELVEALTGRFGDHHGFICAMHLDRIDSLNRWVEKLTPTHRRGDGTLSRRPGIPGHHSRVSILLADVIIAETGADMSRFESPGHLGSWAGLSPGSNESAGRVKSTKTRLGNHSLKVALGVAALSIARHPKDSYLGARYKRIIVRRGKIKAIVANKNAILIAVWHLLAEGECYHEPGGDFFTKKNPDRQKINALRKLHELGYAVTLTNIAEAA